MKSYGFYKKVALGMSIGTVQHTFRGTQFLIRKKILSLVGSKCQVFDEQGRVVLYAEQKAFKLKEDFRIYTDDTKSHEVIRIQARNIIDFAATYDVLDSASERKLGTLKRKGIKSLISDEWLILDERDQPIGLIKEESMALAFIRRFIGFGNLIPQAYDCFIEGQEVCEFKQDWNPFVMKLHVDFSRDRAEKLDRRLGLAAAILITVIEGHQE